ncbi:MAG: ABC transporter permease [Propionibacteriaceae bacterium]|jgi:ABC-2 type transport system permease protein|nr:ABC transporter permease [Propionibacteriaceae bacterium]
MSALTPTTALLAEPARRPTWWRELNAVVAVTARDVTLALRTPGMIALSLLMPIVMMGLIGGNLMENMAGGLPFDFGQFMLVGMIVNMLVMTTTMSMTSLIDDSDSDFSSEMLVAPVSRYAIVVGKILGSSFTALITAVGVIAVGLVMGLTLSLHAALGLLALAPLMCLSGGALAVIVMGSIKSKKAANLVVMLITMPQMFLSGVIIPIGSSTGVLFVLSRILPMTYCVDLARAVVTAGTPEYDSVVLFNPAISLLAIAGLTVVCLVIGTWLYARSERER